MKPFNVLFEEANSSEIIYKEKKIVRSFHFDIPGKTKLKFEFVETNSKYLQCIDLHISGFEGHIFMGGKEIKSTHKSFPQIYFWEDIMPKTFEIDIVLNSGKICICNGARKMITEEEFVCRNLSAGCAMIIEEKEKNKYRCYCNDFVNDDDFDDLIFDLEIIKIEE